MVSASTAWCAWLLLFSPLLAFIGIALVGLRSKRLSAGLAIGGLLLSFACAVSLFI